MSFSLLNAAPQAVADTVVTVGAQGPLSVAVDVAILLMAVGIAVLAILFAMVLRRVDHAISDIHRSVGRHLGPVSDRARAVSENVEFITDALRTDVQRLNASVKALTGRLHQASDHMEERVEEFNALMELVQSEAEEIFLDTAATVRGVREGARTIASGDAKRRHAARDDDDPAVAPPPGVVAPGNGSAPSSPGPDDGAELDHSREGETQGPVSPAAGNR